MAQQGTQKRVVAWLLSLLGAGLLAWLAARRLPLWPDVWAAVDRGWLALALALSVPYMWTRAHRMGVLLQPQVEAAQPGARLRPAVVQGSGLLSFFVVLALPFRLGELSRPVILSRLGIPGVGMEEGLGAQAGEKVVDGLCVVGMLFVGLAFSQPAAAELQAVQRIGQITLAVFVVLTLVGLAFARVPHRAEAFVRACTPAALGDKLAPVCLRVAAALQPLFRWRTGSLFTLWTLVYWTLTVLQLWALAQAFGLGLDLVTAAACVAIVGLSIQLPGGPAQLGSFQVGMATALSLYLPNLLGESGLSGPPSGGSMISDAGASFAVAMYLLQLGTSALACLPAWLLLARARRLGSVRHA